MKTLAQLRRAIQKQYPHLTLIRSPSGYYYWASDTDEKLSLDLAGLHSASVYVYSFSQLTLEQWMQEAENIMKKVDRKG